jgi:hypothetical protein
MQLPLSVPLLGLSKKERLVLDCIRRGLKTPLSIHEATHISRTAIYHIITLLLARGLVHRYKEHGKHYVRMATDKELVETIYTVKKELLGFVDGKEEVHGLQDSTVIVHRGAEAVKKCLLEAFVSHQGERLIGFQGVGNVERWATIFSDHEIGELNKMVKKNHIIMQSVLSDDWIDKTFALMGSTWAKDFEGRATQVHYIGERYFKHEGEIFIFKNTAYLLSLNDKIVIEIRHSAIAMVITMLIRHITDTTPAVDVNRRLRELMEGGQ